MKCLNYTDWIVLTTITVNLLQIPRVTEVPIIKRPVHCYAKSANLFLYDKDLRHKRVNYVIVLNWEPLIKFTKKSVLDIWKGSKYVSSTNNS